MICVITNLTRNFCLALLPQYRDFEVIDSDTSGPPSKKKSSKTESSIEQEGSSFSSWAILTSRTSSNFFRSQSICRMLTIFHMLSHLESNFSHSFVHLARRCHLGSHFVQWCMSRIFPSWDHCYVRTLHSDDRSMSPRFPESSVLESAYRYREGRQLDVAVRSGLRWPVTQKCENKTYSRSVCFSSHVESSADLYSASSRTFPKSTGRTWLVLTRLRCILLSVTSFL